MTPGPSQPPTHAFCKLLYLKEIAVLAKAVLHYNNHDGVIHACVL